MDSIQCMWLTILSVPQHCLQAVSIALTTRVKTNALANADEIGHSLLTFEYNLQISHANGVLYNLAQLQMLKSRALRNTATTKRMYV